MQLRVARLCLNCEELHDQQRCPGCTSESFAYISRWVTPPERRSAARAAVTPPPTSTSKRRMVGYGVLGIGLASLARWWWTAREQIEASALRGAGDLK